MSVSGTGPEFNIDKILGRAPSSETGIPAAKRFHEEMVEAREDLEPTDDDSSWLYAGHPMGDKVGDTELAQLGIQGLLRFGGAGTFGGALNHEGDPPAPLDADPLDFMVNFLDQLAGANGEQVREEFGLDEAEIKSLSKRMNGAAVLAERVVEIRGAGEAGMQAAISGFAAELVDQLDSDGVVYFPLADDKGKYHQIVRVDKEHGFSIIEVNENHSPYVTGLEDLQSPSIRQDVVKHTSIDPLTGEKIESYKTQQFVSFEAKDKERLGDKGFFEALIKGAVLQGVIEGYDSESAANIIYESLPKYVDGKRLKSSDTHSEMYRKVYRYFDKEDKDSSFQSITAALYYMCLDPFFEVKEDNSEGINRFKKIKFLLQSQLFIANVKALEEDKKWNKLTPDQKVFLQDVKANLMRSAEKLLKREVLEAKHVKSFFRACKQVDSILARPTILETAKTADESEVIARGKVVAKMASSRYPVIAPVTSVVVPAPVQALGFGYGGGVHSSNQTVEAKPVEQMIRQLGEQEYSITFDASNAREDLQRLGESVQHLTEVYETLKDNPTLNYKRKGMTFLTAASRLERRAVFDMYAKVLGDLISQLPAPEQGDHGYWAELSENIKYQYYRKIEELTMLVQSFATLERQHRPTIGRERGSEGHSPETTIMMFALQTLQLKLASHLPEFNLEEQSFSHIDYLLEMRAQGFVVEHPALRKMLFDFMRYHNPDWNIEQFTGQLTVGDYKADDGKLFAFTKAGDGSTETWMISLDPRAKKKGVDQRYLEKMLEVEDVREGVLAIITKKNAEFDERHDQAMDRYRTAYETYKAQKEDLERQIIEKDRQILAIKAENDQRWAALRGINDKDLPKLKRLARVSNDLNDRWAWNADALRREELDLKVELDHIDNLDQRIDYCQRIENACRRSLEGPEGELSHLRGRLNGLIEPQEPEHEGYYPVDSVVDQLACLLFDPEGRKLIPPEMNAIIQSVLRGKYLVSKGTEDFALDRGTRFTFKGTWNPLPLDAQKKRRPIDTTIQVAMGDDEGQEIYSGFHSQHYPDQYQSSQLRRRPERDYADWSHRHELESLNDELFSADYTQNRIMHSTRTLFNLDVRTTRELRMIGLDPYDTVSRTIAFLNRHTSLVENAAIRDYINELLFRPERIHTQLRDNPHLCKKIDAFIRQTVEHYAEVKDIDTCVAVIQLGTKLKESAAEIGITDGFSDYRELVLNTIIPRFEDVHATDGQLDDNRAAQLKAYRAIVMMHANNPAAEDLSESKADEIIEDILSLRICRQLQTSGSDVSDADDVLMQQVLLRYQYLLEDEINDEILTAALQVTGQGSELDDAEWETDDCEVYTCGKYEIDISTGQVFVETRPLVVTPDWITCNETLRRVYPHSFDSKTCVKVNETHYILNKGDPKKEVHVSSNDRGDSIEIEMMIKGDLYRYIETPDNLSHSKPTVFDDEVTCWINEYGNMLVFKDGKEKYSLTLDKKAGHCNINSFTRLHDKAFALPFNVKLGIQNPLAEGQEFALSDLFVTLFPFEQDPGYIECWGSSDRNKIMVDFKRLGLSFEVRKDELQKYIASDDVRAKVFQMVQQQAIAQGDGEEEVKAKAQIEAACLLQEICGRIPIRCQNFPGFDLSIPVVLQSLLGSKVPYVTLESDTGERKVLVPKTTEGRIQLGETPLKWYEYDVVKVKSDGFTSNDLASHNVEQQLLQMIMYADQRNFAKVQKIIDRVNPLEALTTSEAKLLEKVIVTLSRYQHPEANALIVKLILLKDVNALKFPQAKSLDPLDQPVEGEGDENTLQQELELVLLKIVAYENYRKTCSKSSSYRLTREEERQFVEIIYHDFKEKRDAVAKMMQNDDEAYSFIDKMVKTIQNKAVGLLPTVFMGLAEQRLGQRYHDLSTGEGKLGTKKVELISMVTPAEIFGEREQKPLLGEGRLQELFLDQLGEAGTQLEIPTPADINRVLNVFDKNAKYWEDNFYVLYYVARSGTEDQKDKLQRALDLATHTNAGGHRLLRWVMSKPSRYPTLEKINQKVEKWRVEAPKKIGVAERELETKEREHQAANIEHRQAEVAVTRLEEQANSALNYGTLKSAKRELATAKEDLAREERRDYPEGWYVRDRRSKIDSLERGIREYEEDLQPRIKEAKTRLKEAQGKLRAANKANQKAEQSLTKAQAYQVKMEEEVRSTCTSMLPNKLWMIIQQFVRPIFKLIPKIWKLFWKGKTFLHKRVYPVRDIFSSGDVKKTRRAIDVDRTFLRDVDASFNGYFAGLVSQYFNVSDDGAIADTVWDATDGGVAVVESKLASEKGALREYREEVRQVREHADLKRGLQIDDLMSELTEKEKVLSISLVQQKEALVWQLNRVVNADEKKRMIVELNRGGQKGDLTWEDLKKLTLNGDLDEFKEKTGLDEAEAKELMRGVADYLVKATRLNQIRFVKGKVAKAQSAKTAGKQKVYYTNVVEALKLTRHYLSESDMESTMLSPKDMRRLWFEYSNGYLYRKEQIALLDENGASDNPETLTEAPTGFGKSKNYVPSRDAEQSEDHLVLNIHPRTIERINAEDIQQQMRDGFGRKADRFHFQRSTQFTVQSLKKMYEELQVNFEEGRPINFSAETLQALELHFLMSLYDFKEAEKSGGMSSEERIEAKKEIEYFILILRAISVYGWATIDESHVNLNPFTNKLIYTIGESTNLEAYQVDILEEIMDLMITDPEIVHIAKIDQNMQAKVTDDEYDDIAQKLANNFAEKYHIEDDHMDEFLDFVLGQLDDVPQWIAKHPQAKKLALVKGMLSLILKSCMDGYVDENFGLSKLHIDKGKEYAIAFASANTPKENETNPSQFKNPHETMIKTYLTYLHKGLRESQVVKMLKQMKEQQLLEYRTTGSLSNTEANKAFIKIAGPGRSLHELTEDDMRALYEDFCMNKQAIFYYIRNIVVPQLKLYDKTLVNTPQNLRSRVQTSESLSATPQHPATHGPDTVMVPMKGTQGQVSHLFLKKVDLEQKIHTSGGSSPQEVLESAVATVLSNDHIKCIIDAGALMRGLSNEHIAGTLRREILKRGTEGIEAIQYFDVEKEKFVVMEVSTGTLSDPSVVKIEPAKIITIFDQPRCFGSDTVQDELASALLLVDSRTDKAKAGQGAGRMRQWHLDQGMEVMMTQEDYDDLFDGTTANIGDLLKLWVTNLAHQEAKENYQGLLQQMDNELRSPAMHRMLGIKTGDRSKGQEDTIRDKKPDVDKALRLFGKFESILVTDDSSDPWRLYAEIPTDQEPEASLDAHLKRTKAKARQLSGFSSSQSKILKSRLGRYSRKWKAPKADQNDERVSLPEFVKSSKVDTGTQVEVQVQAEQEVEQQEQEQRWDDFVERTPSKWSSKINLFKRGWEKPRRQFVFLNRLGRTISKLEPENPVLKAVVRAGLVVAGSALAASAALAAGVAWPIVVAIGSVLALAGLAYVAYSAFAGRNVKYVNNCTYKVRDIMGTHLPRHSKRGARFFSPNLTVSNNYYAQHTPTWRERKQQPFSQEQKPTFNVLVIEDVDKKGRKRLQMMMIDQNDSIYFRRRLQADYEKTTGDDANERTRKIAVYDVSNGLIAVQGKNGFEDGELEDNTEFVELLAQAKVINGDIHFTEGEKTAITARAQKVGAEFMENFAQDHILGEHPVRKALFKQSDFAEALKAV